MRICHEEKRAHTPLLSCSLALSLFTRTLSRSLVESKRGETRAREYELERVREYERMRKGERE